MNLANLSQDLKQINDSFKHINAGGCGVFANLLGNRLKKDQIKFKYVLFSDTKNISMLASIRNFKNPNFNIDDPIVRWQNGYGIAHIMIYYKGVFIDSTGVYKNLGETRWNDYFGYRLSAILPQEILEAWCNQDTWNDMFNRDQIPNIKEKIETLTLN